MKPTRFGSACITVASHLWEPSLTVGVLLVRIGHQAAVVRPGRHVVWHAVVVVIAVTRVPEPVVVRVQLRAVWQLGTVVLGVLMPIPIAAQKKGRQVPSENVGSISFLPSGACLGPACPHPDVGI